MKDRVVSICIYLFILVCLTSCTEKSTSSPEVNPEQEIADEVAKTIISIFNGSMMYHQDYGEDPPDVSELITLEYLTVDEMLISQWDFSFDRVNPLTGITAESKIEMPYGEGRVIKLCCQTGKFSGWFSDCPKPETDFAGEAHRSIKALHNAILMYRQDYSEDPLEIERDLLDLEYLEIVEWVLNEWEFSFEGSDSITGIRAISTPLMDYGEGKEITFSLQTGRFSGWFSDNAKTEKDFSDEAKLAITMLHNTLYRYVINNGKNPEGGVEEILELTQHRMSEWVLKEWDFSFTGTDSITGINAVSTDVMGYGEGKIIQYNLTSLEFPGEFSGWIFDDIPLELLVAIYVQYIQGARRDD